MCLFLQGNILITVSCMQNKTLNVVSLGGHITEFGFVLSNHHSDQETFKNKSGQCIF